MPSVLKYCLLIICSLATVATAAAQGVALPKTNSPFSRFGIGDPAARNFAAQLGMGSIGQGYHDSHISNQINPASLASLRYATYHIGVGLSRDQLTSGDQSTDGLNGNLRYLSLAFTTRNTLNDLLDARERRTRYAMSLSVTPYSTQGYNIELRDQLGNVGEVVNGFLGSGGYYRLRTGQAIEIDKHLRFGLHIGYIFGRTDSRTSLRTADLANGSQVFDTESLRARGVDFELGGQYDFVLEREEDRPQKILTVGLTGTYTGVLQGNSARLITRNGGFGGLDTVLFEERSGQRINMPRAVGGGFYYTNVNHFSFGADLRFVGWNSYRNSVRPDERLSSGITINAGGEWIPDYQAYSKLHRIVRYRFGGYYEQDPRPGVNADRGLTLGFGIPVIRPREELSYVNLSLNAGALATSGTIEQRYLRLTVGFALTDNSWFYKRRFK